MNAWIHVAGWTLVHFVWQGALTAVAAAAGLRILRPASAHVRYSVACTALAAMLASPVITARLLSGSAAVALDSNASQSVSSAGTTSRGDEAVAASRAGGVSATAPHAFSVEAARLVVNRFVPLVVAIWLAGVAILLVRLAGGWWRVRRLHRASLAMAASRWHAAGERIASRLHLGRAVHVVDSWLVDTPTLVGWLRPVILLPIAALANLTPAQVEAILAHELAHVRRHDYLVNLLQAVAETVLFYHPAVWWVSARIRTEREHCCDDVAVAVSGDAVGYAGALAELETSRTQRRLQTALTLAATGGSLLERVRRVLGAQAEDKRPSSNAVMTVALVLLFIVGAAGVYRVPALGATTEAGAKTASVPPVSVAPARGSSPPVDVRVRQIVIVRDAPFEARATIRTGPFAARVQSTSHAVSGTIVDATGVAIPDATVVITHIPTNTDQVARTNQSGYFEFVGLPASEYLLEAEAPGFEALHDRVTVPLGQTVQRNITLQIQTVTMGFMIVGRGPVQVSARGSGPPQLPSKWTCLPESPFGGRGFCGPPSLVQEFEHDGQEQQAALRGERAQPARSVRTPPPAYPQDLWQAMIEGSVILEGRISTEGSPTGYRVVAPVHPGLAKVVMEAVSQWRFEPARLNGVVIEAPFTATFNFRLHQ